MRTSEGGVVVVAASGADNLRSVSDAERMDRALQRELPAFGLEIQNAESGGRYL